MRQAQTRYSRISRVGLGLALLGACLSACERSSGSPVDEWKRRTQAFLESTIERHDPYPIIHLPQRQPSLYEQSAAIIALAQSGQLEDGAVDVDAFTRFALGKQNTNSGYIVDDFAGEPPAASWYALRALDALGRFDRVSSESQLRMVHSASAAMVDKALEPDAFNRVYHFRLVDLLAERGGHEVARVAREAIARSRSGVDCADAFTARDVDLWAAAVEMAAVADVKCSLPAAKARQLIQEIRAVSERSSRSGRFSLAEVERLQGIATIARESVSVADELRSTAGAEVAALQQALGDDRVEPYPATLAVAARALNGQGLPVSLGADSRLQMTTVLHWGAMMARFAPSAPLFGMIARSIALLPGKPDHSEMAKLVDWDAIEGLDRLELAAHLNPRAIRESDFAAALDHFRRGEQRPDGRPTLVVGRSVAAVAAAAKAGGMTCSGGLRDWVSDQLDRIAAARTQIALASYVVLGDAIRLVGFAISCGDTVGATARTLVEEFAARGGILLRESVRAAQVREITPTEFLSGLQLACATAVPLDNSARAAAVAFARTFMQKGTGVPGDDGSPFSPQLTYTVLAIEKLGESGCS